MDLITKKLAGIHGGRILDVATEEGGFIQKLKEALEDFDEVTGVDIDDESLQKARETFKGEPVSFLKMDGATLKFDDDTFDTVSIHAGLHHLSDIGGTLREMKRVLKPGGLFVLRESFCDHQTEKQQAGVDAHHWLAKIDRLLERPHNPTLNKQDIIDFARNLGLKQLEFQERICDQCPRARGETIEEELAELDELLARVEGHPSYDELKEERDRIAQRFNTVGVACATELDVVGIK